MDLDTLDPDAGKEHWLTDPMWQGVRRAVETINGSSDYLEQYFAVNIVFEPLVAELIRSGFVMQCAAANNDFVTPAIVSAAEADFEHNLANAMELFHILANDAEHGEANRQVMQLWCDKYVELCHDAAQKLQPIWSQARAKPVSYLDSQAAADNRFNHIANELGLS